MWSRKHNVVGGASAAGYFNHRSGKRPKRTSPQALKRLINSELEDTSTVTAVLISSGTTGKAVAQYEIVESIERGNRVLGVHINSIKGRDQSPKPLGRVHLTLLALKSARTA